jgi:serine/threonine-protein kinase
VLPFRAVGANADGEALCAGLGEILTNKLRQLERFQRSLHVVSAADVSKERVGSAREALNAFGATLSVSGSLQWNGDKILVGANLVDARSQLVLAARDFEVSARDIPGIGRLLVESVAQMLDLELHPEMQPALADPPSATYAPYLQGRGYLQRYDRVESIDRALTAFDNSLAQDPAYALAHAGKAEAWLRRYQIVRDPAALELARASSRRALELGRDLAQVHFTTGLVELSGGEYARAIESLRTALQIEPANADAMRELGNAYDAAGKGAEAEKTFRQAAELRPDSWAASKDLAVFYNRHGRLRDALPWFQRVVAITPDSYASYSNLGGIYLRLGRHAEAAAALQKSLALRPTSKAYMNFGTIRYFEGRFQEASDAYRKAAELAPSDERTWGALADALRWLPGNADEVIGAYRQAIALAEQKAAMNPSDGELRSRLAMYHAYAGDRDAADSEISEALRLAPGDGAVLFRAALVHEQLGRRYEALAALEQAFLAGYSREEIGHAPALEQLRQDARYAGIAEKPAGTIVQRAP